MATSSRRELAQPNARINRTVRNTPKPGESGQQGPLRRARSVPSSPDRLRPSANNPTATGAPSSTNAGGRPASSFNPRTASGSSSSSAHGKSALSHSVPDVVGAKQAAGAIRRRAATDKSTSGAATTTSVWPHAVAASSKDPASGSRAAAAKSSPSSHAQKSTKLSTRPGAEKTAAAASQKPRTTKAATTGAGKAQAASSSLARGAGAAAAKRRMTTGSDTTSAPSPIQRTTSVPAPAPEASGKQDVELLMEEFDETESISTPSIEEHLQQRLPDPVDVTTYAAASSEDKNGQEKHQDLDSNAGIDGGAAAVVEEAAGENELKEAELNEAAAGEIESTKGAVDDETQRMNEAAGSVTSELKDPELVVVKEEAEVDKAERIVVPPSTTKAPEAVAQRWRKDDDGRSNEARETEEGGRSKATTSANAMQERRNKVMALVGRFETAMSARE